MTQDTTEKTLADLVAEAVRRGREEPGGAWKIHAIRHLRVATGAGLNEAKTLIERYEATGDCRTEGELIRDRLTAAEATIERLTGPEARERLARHLRIRYGIGGWTWDEMDEESRERFRVLADEAIAALAGEE